MKNSAVFISSILLTLLCASIASAETRVEISNNGSGSKANVNIRNSTSVTNHEQSDSSVKTSIKITTNGETKTYESDKPESVHIESSDGSAKVDVSQNVNTTQSTVHQSTKSNTTVDVKAATDKKKADIKKKIEEKKKEIEQASEIKESLFDRYFPFFKGFRLRFSDLIEKRITVYFKSSEKSAS